MSSDEEDIDTGHTINLTPELLVWKPAEVPAEEIARTIPIDGEMRLDPATGASYLEELARQYEELSRTNEEERGADKLRRDLLPEPTYSDLVSILSPGQELAAHEPRDDARTIELPDHETTASRAEPSEEVGFEEMIDKAARSMMVSHGLSLERAIALARSAASAIVDESRYEVPSDPPNRHERRRNARRARRRVL